MRHFWRNRKGNVAVMFAVAVVPIVGAVGAAIDYSMANAYRADMQKALDSTALAISKVMPMEEAALHKAGMDFFMASLGKHNLTNLKLVIAPEQGAVTLHATGNYKPTMAGLFGANQFEVGVDSEARWGIGKVEVALVLDNSGSMTDYSRMTHLKAAAHDLLKVLQSSAREPEDAKVAIVTFDQRVNVDTANKDASWLRWDLWEAANGTCNKSGGYNSESTCIAQKLCSKSQYTTKKNCEDNKGKWEDAKWTPEKDRKKWNGCVEDRNKDNDVSDAAPTNSATRYPTAQCEHGLSYPGLVSQMRSLTTDWAALGTTIDAMKPAGYTNIAIGLAWGWHLLSPTEVGTQGKAYGTENLTKYVILMTDGDNTKNRFGDSTATMNTRVSTVCSNMKNLKDSSGNSYIKIYTIRLVSGNATLLENCASNKSMYYDVQDASSLAGVFSSIGAEIASLHLAK